jgi:hypothetical protein
MNKHNSLRFAPPLSPKMRAVKKGETARNGISWLWRGWFPRRPARTGVSCPFHNGNFIIGEAVEAVDDLVDEVVGGLDLPGQTAVFPRMISIDVNQATAAAHAAGQFAHEAGERFFGPAEAGVEGDGAAAVAVDVGTGGGDVFVEGLRPFAFVAQFGEGVGVG